jgi:hypothetical protein
MATMQYAAYRSILSTETGSYVRGIASSSN